jgi:PAS domain S-box-containing protein
MKKRWSIRTYLWLLALAVVLPAAVVLAYSIASEARHAERAAQATALSLAQLGASQTQRTFDDAETIASRLTQRPRFLALDQQQPPRAFDEFLPLHPEYANVVVCDAGGRFIHSAAPGPRPPGPPPPDGPPGLRPSGPPPPGLRPPGRPLDELQADWVKTVVKNKRLVVGKPKIGVITGRWGCVLGYPIFGQADESGEVKGALGISIDLERLQVGGNLSGLPPGSEILIVDEEGTVVTRSSDAGLWVGRQARGTQIVDEALAQFEGNRTARGVDHKMRIYGFTTIPKIGWHVCAGIPTDFTFAAVHANAWRAGVFGAVLLGLVVGLVLFVAGLINRPVATLFRAATAGTASSEIEIPSTGPGEIITVAEQFKQILSAREEQQAEVQKLNADLEVRVRERTGELEAANHELQREVLERKRAEEALRAHRQELQDYIDGMSTLNAKVALDGTFLLVNRFAREAFGLAADELMKTSFLEGRWWTFDPQVQARVREAFMRACRGTPVNYDERIFAFGKVTDINFSIVPVRANDGRISYVVAEGRDITGLKTAETALATRTAQLEGANLELEAFCYSVSHDLRAPLRAIEGFARVLAEEYRQGLDQTGHTYLEKVRKSVVRMSELIDDLLELSRVSRSELLCTNVNLSAMASAIAAELRSTAPARDATISIQPEMVAHGDPGLLRIAVENLLGNAWKFSRDRTHAVIEFGTTRKNEQSVYFVRDNGVGFDMKHAHKLFGAFERLHSVNEFEGHGVGLATVRRIVRRHGGDAWGEGLANEGAVFYFTLPSAKHATEQEQVALSK